MRYLTVVIHDDGPLWCEVAEMPGVHATGDTLDELQESLAEAVGLWVTPEGADPPRVMLDLAGWTTDWPRCRARAELIDA